MAQSLVNDAEQGGSFPRWALANTATAEMSGDSVVPLIVNFYAFGARDFDVHAALRYMVNAATKGGVGLNGYVERPEIATYLQRGYLPETAYSCVVVRSPVPRSLWSGRSTTLPSPNSRPRWAIPRPPPNSRTEHSTGRTCSIPPPATSRPVMPWVCSLGPRRRGPRPGCFSQLGFDEGNAEQYVWYVPQNIAGLVTALGGRKAVGDRLDRFTKQLNVGPEEPYLWAGNEPGFDVPWLYNYIGQPWKTQHLVDRVRSELFTPTPDGEPGNDDLGAMSSWYVWAALGLYPSTPGTSILTVNTPLFDRAVIELPAGKFIQTSRRAHPGRTA